MTALQKKNEKKKDLLLSFLVSPGPSVGGKGGKKGKSGKGVCFFLRTTQGMLGVTKT